MSRWSVEFDFVQDGTGDGQFVPITGDLSYLRTLLARGDVAGATSLYEQMGPSAAPELLEEARQGTPALRETLAQVFRHARDHFCAAQVLDMSGNPRDAAPLYEVAGAHLEAATAYQAAGDALHAAAAYECAGRVDLALVLYQRAHGTDGQARCLARLGRFPEAAALYRDTGNVPAEVEMLRQVPLEHPERIPATRRLAELYAQHGQAERAVQVIVETARSSEAARRDPHLPLQLVGLLEGLGRTQEAARVRELAGVQGPAPAAAPVPTPQLQTAGEGYAHLKAIPIFGELSLPDMKDLFHLAKVVTYPAGRVLIEQGVLGQGLLVITHGQVDVLALRHGTEKLLNQLGAGAYVGEISLVRDVPTSARVVARTPVHALFLAHDAFANFLDSHAQAASRIYRLFTHNLADRVRALTAMQ